MRKLELVQRMFTFFAVVFLLPLAAFANDTLYEKAKGEGKVLLYSSLSTGDTRALPFSTGRPPSDACG